MNEVISAQEARSISNSLGERFSLKFCKIIKKEVKKTAKAGEFKVVVHTDDPRIKAHSFEFRNFLTAIHNGNWAAVMFPGMKVTISEPRSSITLSWENPK
jgi:hypothetical protein